MPLIEVTHLQMCNSLSSAENSGVVKTDDMSRSKGGGVSLGLDMKCELTLDLDCRE